MKILVFAFMLIFLITAGSATSNSMTEDTKLDKEALDSYIEGEMKISRIPGLALGVIKNGEIAYLQGYGSAGDSQPVSPETPFIIGSLSKSFTALAAMQLAEAGKLDLDDPVKKYLPWFTMQGEYDPGEITVRHLLVQTSGIPNMAGVNTMAEGSDLSLEQEVKRLSEESLENSPGAVFAYSNANYLILGLIIDEITKEGYSEYMRNNIFQPLEMNNSYLTKDEGENASMAKGHVRWFGFPFPVDVQYLDNSLPAGFIISSVKDMSNYLLMHLNQGTFNEKEILSSEGISELHTPSNAAGSPIDYAMGLIVKSSNDFTLVHHDGSNQGFNSAMAFSPDEKWGVVVLTNTSGQIELPANSIALDVANLLRGEETEGISRIPVVLQFALILVLLVMLILAVRSLILLPRRWAVKLKEDKPKGLLNISTRVVLPVALELLVPFLVFYYIPAGAGFPVWQLYMLFHPGMVYGLFMISILLLGKALWRSYLAVKLFSTAKG
ncbi:MAG: serine hydrolase domain-containing protein [Bacillota bacterium]